VTISMGGHGMKEQPKPELARVTDMKFGHIIYLYSRADIQGWMLE
jgi:hypothetical protein